MAHMTSSQGPEEIGPNEVPQGLVSSVETESGRRRRSKNRPAQFDPLHLAPPAERKRWAACARDSHRAPLKAIRLMCLQCCGWERSEAKACQITSCALWALSNLLFKRVLVEADAGSKAGPEGSLV